MTNYFFDTSALVKRYIRESGTTWVKSITSAAANNAILISDITPTEVIAAIQRRLRQGEASRGLSAGAAANARLLFHRDIPRFYRVTLIPDILKVAERLPLRHSLRAYDAIQLATALITAERFIASELSPLVFVSSDTGLIAAAEAENLQTENPNNYD